MSAFDKGDLDELLFPYKSMYLTTWHNSISCFIKVVIPLQINISYNQTRRQV